MKGGWVPEVGGEKGGSFYVNPPSIPKRFSEHGGVRALTEVDVYETHRSVGEESTTGKEKDKKDKEKFVQ